MTRHFYRGEEVRCLSPGQRKRAPAEQGGKQCGVAEATGPQVGAIVRSLREPRARLVGPVLDFVIREINAPERRIHAPVAQDVDQLQGLPVKAAAATHDFERSARESAQARRAKIGPEFPHAPGDQPSVALEFLRAERR